MNNTDKEMEYALRNLGTANWRPTVAQRDTLVWLLGMLVFPVWLEMQGYEHHNRDLDGVVRVVNACANPAALLNKDYWMAVYCINQLRSPVFMAVTQLPAEHIEAICGQHLHPVDYMRLIEEGMPIEYATEATRLT